MPSREYQGQERRSSFKHPQLLIKETVHETLTTIGFDLTRPTEIQADVAYLRRARHGAEQMVNRVRWSVIGLFSTGIFTLLCYGASALVQMQIVK